MPNKMILPKKYRWSLIPIILVLITYINSVNYEFVSDDRAFLQNNPKLTNQAITKYFTQGVWSFSNILDKDDQLYRPAALMHYRWQSKLFGETAKGFHFVNVMSLMLVACVAFMLLASLFPIASGKSLALGTSLFVLHPANSEVVSWILASGDLLMITTIFIGFLFFLKSPKRFDYRLIIIGSAFLLIGYFTKETAYLAPFLFFVLLQIKNRLISIKKRLTRLGFTIIPLLIVIYLRSLVINPNNLEINNNGIKTAIFYFFGYLKMLVLPLPYKFFLSETSYGKVQLWELLVGLIVLCCFLFFLWKRKTDRDFLVLTGAWILISLAPAIAIAFHPEQKTFAARMLFLPSFSLGILFVYFSINGTKNFIRNLNKFSTLIIISFVLISINYGKNWENQKSFIELALSSTPDNIDLNLDLGDYYAEHRMMNKAVENYEIVVSNHQASKKAKIVANERLGEFYAMKNQFNKAIQAFESVIKLAPERANGRVGLGNIYWMKGELKQAELQYKLALELNPKDFTAKQNLQLVQRLLNKK